jgi:hypothetical protein
VKIAKRVLVTLAIVMFGLLVWVGVFPPHHGRIPANEATAIRNIQRLNVAQQRYAARHLEVGFACNLTSLGQQESGLGIDDSIDPVLASGTRSGYHFELRCSRDRNGKAMTYEITALPLVPGTTGNRAFCTDQTSKIWYSKNGSSEECLTRQKQMQLE